jgi:hypothetical protein
VHRSRVRRRDARTARRPQTKNFFRTTGSWPRLVVHRRLIRQPAGRHPPGEALAQPARQGRKDPPVGQGGPPTWPPWVLGDLRQRLWSTTATCCSCVGGTGPPPAAGPSRVAGSSSGSCSSRRAYGRWPRRPASSACAATVGWVERFVEDRHFVSWFRGHRPRRHRRRGRRRRGGVGAALRGDRPPARRRPGQFLHDHGILATLPERARACKEPDRTGLDPTGPAGSQGPTRHRPDTRSPGRPTVVAGPPGRSQT